MMTALPFTVGRHYKKICHRSNGMYTISFIQLKVQLTHGNHDVCPAHSSANIKNFGLMTSGEARFNIFIKIIKFY
jgi:hypothetical protein